MHPFAPLGMAWSLLLAAAAVYAANPEASKRWTLVGCDDYPLDDLFIVAKTMANDAVKVLDGLMQSDKIGDDDGSDKWYLARMAYMLWGVDFTDLEGGMVRFQDNALKILKEARGMFSFAAGPWKGIWLIDMDRQVRWPCRFPHKPRVEPRHQLYLL